MRFPFRPTPDKASALERVFGAARWVHNQGLLIQWRAFMAKEPLPSRAELVKRCLTVPITQSETAWLGEMPRAVLLDEIDDLVEYTADLPNYRSERELPLRRKKGDQDMYFPRGSFSILPSEESEDLDLLRLEGIGTICYLPVTINELVEKHGRPDTVKLERTRNFVYWAELIF